MNINTLKITIGILIITFSGFALSEYNPRERNFYVSDAELERFPLLNGERQNAKFEGIVLFIYSPGDCYLRSSLRSMQNWHKVTSEFDKVISLNILQEESHISAKRYLSEFPISHRTRLDSTGWIKSKLNLSTTPALVLLSRNQQAEVIYPLQSSLTESDRLQRLEQL